MRLSTSDRTLAGMDELELFLKDVLPRQIEAETAIHNGDVEPRIAMWSTRDPVTLFGAVSGPAKAGTDNVRRVFRWIAAGFSDCTAYEFELVAAGVSGDLAYTVGYERCTRSWQGGPPEDSTLRVTHVYRREDGEWKIVHRHGDLPPEDLSPSA